MSFFNNQWNPNPNVNQDAAEYNKCLSKYTIARSNLLGVLGFTVLNVILAILNASVYMLFSAQVPYVFAAVGYAYAAETGDNLYLIVGAVMAIIITLPYLFFWIFSKKHYGWMIAALVYFAVDCIFLVINFDVSMLIDIVFHAWVMYYLIIGVKYGKILKNKYNFTLDIPKPINNVNAGIDESFLENDDDNQNFDK